MRFIKQQDKSYRCHRQGSQQRNTWPRCWVTCHYVCCPQRQAECRWGAPPNASTWESCFLSEWTWEICTSLSGFRTKQTRKWNELWVRQSGLPRLRVDVVSVQVVDEAVFIGWQRFVPAVDVDAAAGTVICAGVTIASLRNGPFCLQHQPFVGF